MSDHAEKIKKLQELQKQVNELKQEEASKDSELIDQMYKILETLNETGNAERFVKLAKEKLIFVMELNQWVYWEKEKWNIDEDGFRTRLFKNVVDEINLDHSKVLPLLAKDLDLDKDELKTRQKQVGSIKLWANRSKNKQVITNSLNLATHEAGVSKKYAEFDSKGHFFGVGNGVVNRPEFFGGIFI